LYDEPREILKAIPGIKIVEMVHNRINAICCGGGGGGMYLDTFFKSKGMDRLSDRRIKEAIDTGADILAVACPYEPSRFEDALKVDEYAGFGPVQLFRNQFINGWNYLLKVIKERRDKII
jgi:Fe-S oxidoreductase